MRMKGTKLDGNAYFYIVIMAVMLVIVVSSIMMPYFASKLLPILFGSAGFILAAIGFSQHVLFRAKPKTGDKEKKAVHGEAAPGWGIYMAHVGWVVGFALAIYLIGLRLAMPLFILFYMKWLRTRWLSAIAYAAVTVALVYLLFEVALQLDLYKGILFTWLGR